LDTKKSPVALVTVVYLYERWPTGWVTTECSVPVSTVRSMGWPLILIIIVIRIIGSRETSRIEPSLSYSSSQPSRAANLTMFLPGAGSPAGGLILSLDNLTSAPGLGVCLEFPGLLGTFILPVPFLSTGDTLISP
jgi:hypothetical protein